MKICALSEQYCKKAQKRRWHSQPCHLQSYRTSFSTDVTLEWRPSVASLVGILDPSLGVGDRTITWKIKAKWIQQGTDHPFPLSFFLPKVPWAKQIIHLLRNLNVAHCCGCYEKLSHSGWLKTREMYSLTVLEPEVLSQSHWAETEVSAGLYPFQIL